jgi:DNA mismatch endonuclease (patch repair protein)
MDTLTSEQRSRVMARVRGKDTGPELRVRKTAHALGLRFRLHRKDLKGCPDLVFPKHRVAIFVHGCFWHQHAGCKRATMPASRHDFWKTKLTRNVIRDRECISRLQSEGWRVEVIWECEAKKADWLTKRMANIFFTRRPKPGFARAAA